MRLERALLLEKLEEKTPAHVDDSEGSESESSVTPLLPRKFYFHADDRLNKGSPPGHSSLAPDDEAAMPGHPTPPSLNLRLHPQHITLPPA
jgi:hypothetical protein